MSETGRADDILNALSSLVTRYMAFPQSVACDCLLCDDDMLEEKGEDLLAGDVSV